MHDVPTDGSARWRPEPAADPALTAAIAQASGLSPTVAAIVARRAGSLEAARRWLSPEAAPLCDPFALGGMREAVARLRRAIAAREPITVFGDYDTDGVTGTALLTQALLRLGAVAKPFFPDRATEGYGLTPEAVARCLTYAPAPTLVVTVDCGITCAEEVTWLRARGIDTVITDHHVPPATLPDAVAIVNPRLSAPPGAEGMCGCATAFTLVRALAAEGLGVSPEDFLDLVAVATVADVMKLTGDNRALVARGLRVLGGAAGGNVGLRALLRLLRLPMGSGLTAERVAFGLMPCVNAAGRLGRLREAWALIGLGREAHAQTLRAANEERRALERALVARLEAALPERAEGALVLGGEDFHPGVVGIAAARLMERVGAPVALVCRTPDGGGHGSMRACGPWHAVAALDTVRDLLSHYGGHAAAAGFTLLPGAYDAFRERLPRAFSGPRGETSQPYDADLSHIPITLTLCRELERLEPCGHGNPRPRFRKGFTLESFRPVGADGSHLSLRLRPDDGGEPLKAVWFGAAHRARLWRPGMRLHALFTLEIDTFREPCPALRLCAVAEAAKP